MSRRRQGHPGPGRRPGAKVDKPSAKTAEERRVAIEKRIAAEVARFDFTRRCIELRRINKTYQEIAVILTEESGERVTPGRVRRHVLNELRNVDATNDVRYAELDKLESMAAKVRERIEEYEARPEHLFDIEEYTKIVETYLKYRDRIAKLLGIDQGGSMGGKDVLNGAAKEMGSAAASQHLHLHVGSVEAYEEWAELKEKGLTQLAHDVLELQAGDEPDVTVTGMHNDAAGTTLAPYIDVTPLAEQQAEPKSSLEALALMESDALGKDAR